MEYFNMRARRSDSLLSYIKGEVFVDEDKILRISHSGAPALKCWCDELVGKLDFDYERTLLERELHKEDRVKLKAFIKRSGIQERKLVYSFDQTFACV